MRQGGYNLDGVVGRRVRVDTSAVVLARYQWLVQLAVPQLQQRRDDVGVRHCVVVDWWLHPVVALRLQRRHNVRVTRHPERRKQLGLLSLPSLRVGK